MRAVIIEDSSNVVNLLSGYLREQNPEVELAGVADSLETAEALVLQEDPGLLFLDIQIKRGTAFDLLRRLQDAGRLRAHLIFITGHGSKENAVRALKYSALDFIEKPIDPAQLRSADLLVQKAEAHLAMEQIPAAVRELERAVDLNPEYPRTFYVLGQAHRKQGLKRKAQEAWKQYLERTQRWKEDQPFLEGEDWMP